MIEWRDVVSSNIARVGYNEPDEALVVEFMNGSQYQYADVPYGVFEDMVNAPSVGQFFHREVKNNYDYQRL